MLLIIQFLLLQCTDKCIDVGKGSVAGKLTCRIGDETVGDKYCNQAEKPDLSCPNSRCNVQWNISDWSYVSLILYDISICNK